MRCQASQRVGRRRAFTMVELLLAGTVSALAATAGAALIFAIANASQTTRDLRETTSAGHYALNRIGETIREARAIGQVTSSSVTLWVQDTNGDDKMTANEMAIVRYDSGAKQIIYQYTNAASASSTSVTYANFTNLTSLVALATALGSSNVQSVPWAKSVETFSMTGYPSLTDTRVVEVAFTIGTGADAVNFRVAASPKGSGDYLFTDETRIEPTVSTDRVRRAYFSTWTGFDANPLLADPVYGTPITGGIVAN